VWVGPPAFGVPLAVGAVSFGDTLFLSIRYTAGDLSRDAASEFAGVLRNEVEALCT
jgi:hypothetical protein